MTFIRSGASRTVTLQIGTTLSIAAGTATGSVTRLANPQGGEPYPPVVYDGTAASFGPYDAVALFRITCDTGFMDYTQSQVAGVPPSPRYVKSLSSGDASTVIVPIGAVLNIADTTGSGLLVPVTSGEPGAPVVFNGSAQVIGPFTNLRLYRVRCDVGIMQLSTAYYTGTVTIPLSISGAPNPAVVGTGSVFSPVIKGGVQPYNLSVISGSLPPGRALSDVNEIGNYTQAGNYSYVLRVVDDTGNYADLSVSEIVSAAPVTPTLSVTGPLAFTVGAAAGTLVANISNVPAGATPTIAPNDGRLAVAGDAANGWKLVVGIAASTAGNINVTVSATGAISASVTVVVSAASATEVSTYSFTDQGEILPFKPAWQTSGGGPYYPCLIDVTGVTVWQGVADYLCYYSTDHASGQGGIGIMLCRGDPGVPANWKDQAAAVAAGWYATWTGGTVPADNPVFKSTRGTSSQTETPWVMYIGGQFALYYQVAAGTASNVGGRNQPTCRQVSTDGINWGTPASTGVLAVDVAQSIGNGHTGYFRFGPNVFSGVSALPYIGYSLTGGTDRSSQGMWAATDPIAGAWTFIQPLMRPAGRLKGQPSPYIWSFIGSDIRNALTVSQGVSIVGGLGAQGISGTENGAGEIYEVLLDSTGANIIGRPQKLLGRDFAPNTGLGCFTPTMLTANGKKVMIYQALATNGTNSLRIATSPVRDPANTKFLPVTPDLPAGRVTRIYNFAASTTTTYTPPAGLTELSINDGASKVLYNGNGYRFGVPQGTTPIPEHYLFEQGFVPSAQQMIEVKAEGVQSTATTGASAFRKFFLGFTGSRTLSASAMPDVLCLSNADLPSITGANPLRFAQMVAGSRSNISSAAVYHPGIGYGSDTINQRAPKYLGIRWFPQLGKAYLLAEGRTAGGVETEEIPLDAAFLPGGSLFNTTLYPFMGYMAENSSLLIERVLKLTVVQA